MPRMRGSLRASPALAAPPAARDVYGLPTGSSRLRDRSRRTPRSSSPHRRRPPARRSQSARPLPKHPRVFLDSTCLLRKCVPPPALATASVSAESSTPLVTTKYRLRHACYCRSTVPSSLPLVGPGP
ncbi:hypothetical protein EVAR_76360_1 [Eumeta japonica]|uniref:Uncharacterized protein n=1 Tax=Eumeta variegata TaxID=151549 RepID=A0A4C1TAK1_EUMVA|nr:hypothetical protein EVAR_76360_1 [Eumeta japonica]